jgi:hypothetical protein
MFSPQEVASDLDGAIGRLGAAALTSRSSVARCT